MGFHHRRLVTLLDVGVMASGSPGGGDILPVLDGLGVWYKADDGASSSFAAQFTAANIESLSIVSNPSLVIGGGSFTLGGWLWISALTGLPEVYFGKRNPEEYQIFSNAGVFYCFFNQAAGGFSQISGVLPSLGAWHFVIEEYDAGVHTLYTDNAVTVSAAASAPLGGVAPLALGAGAEGAHYTNTRMQNWFLFGRGLSTAERTFLWNGGTGRRFEELTAAFKTQLRAWWPLDEVSGSRRDVSGNNNTLTDNNTVTQAAGWVRNAATNGGLIQFWNDSGPNDIDLGQVNPLYQPTWVANVRNGRPVARFDGLDDWMDHANVLGSLLFGTDQVTVFAVTNQLSTDTQNGICGWQQTLGSNQVAFYYFDGDMLLDIGSVPTGRLHVTQPLPWTATWHLVEGIRSGVTGEFVVDGTLAGTGAVGGSLNNTLTFLWTVGRDGPASSFFAGVDIAELIVYSRALTTTERDSVRNYLKAKWGIAQNKVVVNTAATGYVLINSTTNDRWAFN